MLTSSRLEVEPSRELEVAAAGIACGTRRSSKVSGVHTGSNTTKCHLVGYVLAVHSEDELYPLWCQVEASTDTGVHVVDAGISQPVEGHHARRIAKHEIPGVAERASGSSTGNRRACTGDSTSPLGRSGDITIEVGHASQSGGGY